MSREFLAPPTPRRLPAHRLELRRQHLLDEIGTRATSVNVRAWQRAWRRGPLRTRLVIAIVLFLLLAGAGTAVGFGINLLAQEDRFEQQRERIPGEPKRIGPLVEITSGPGWSLVAWRSNSGICLDFAVAQSSGGGCGFGVRGEPRDTAHAGTAPPEHWISGAITSGPGGATVIDGVVAEQVARVEVVLTNGRVLRPPVIEAPIELETDVDFFLVQVPAVENGGVRVFIAFGDAGKVLERRA
jgi:hypothetical protein